MSRILIIDDDVDFILNVQKILPRGTEWVASVNNDRIKSLAQKQTYDLVLSRKKNENLVKQLLGSAVENQKGAFDHPFKKIIVLPDILWRGRLRQALGGK